MSASEARDAQETAKAIADILKRRGGELDSKTLKSIARRLYRIHADLAVALGEPMF